MLPRQAKTKAWPTIRTQHADQVLRPGTSGTVLSYLYPGKKLATYHNTRIMVFSRIDGADELYLGGWVHYFPELRPGLSLHSHVVLVQKIMQAWD